MVRYTMLNGLVCAVFLGFGGSFLDCLDCELAYTNPQRVWYRHRTYLYYSFLMQMNLRSRVHRSFGVGRACQGADNTPLVVALDCAPPSDIVRTQIGFRSRFCRSFGLEGRIRRHVDRRCSDMQNQVSVCAIILGIQLRKGILSYCGLYLDWSFALFPRFNGRNDMFTARRLHSMYIHASPIR